MALLSSIKAKPIIDIAVAVDDFNDILAFEEALKNDGFYYRPNAGASIKNQLLFACGSYYEDKLVAAPEGIRFTKEEITKAVYFQEQFYEYEIEICA